MFYIDKLLHILYQMLSFLPTYVLEGLRYVNLKNIYEIRLRGNQPILVNYHGKYRYLGVFGITEQREKALKCTTDDIEDCVYRASNYSVYSIEEQIKQGFITAKGGVRLGLAGEYVMENGKSLAIRNVTSLCIRIPHEIWGCGEEIFQRCMSDKLNNVLISSPPGMGKTTILRDLGRILSVKTQKNILICDERGEISCGNIGETCDVVKYTDKYTAFTAGIRALRPEIIITDELSEMDCVALENAINAGIVVIASAHFSAFEYIKTPFLKIFERFVILDGTEVGRIKGVYESDGRELKEC